MNPLQQSLFVGGFFATLALAVGAYTLHKLSPLIKSPV